MKNSQVDFLKNNLRIFYLTNGLSSLIFFSSTWAAYELKYLTFSQLTIIEGLVVGTQLLMELPTGALADLLGRKTTIVISHLLRAASAIVFSFAHSFNAFFIYALLLGMGEAMGSGSGEALLYDTLKQSGTDRDFSKYLSKLGLIFQVGLAASALIGGFMDTVWFRLPALAYAAVSIAAGISSIKFIEPDIDTQVFTLKNYLRQTTNGVKEITKNSYVFKLSFFYMIVGGITWLISYSLRTLVLTDLGFSSVEIGTFQAVVRILGNVWLFRIIKAGKLITKKRAFTILPLMLICSLVPFYWLSKWMALPFLAVSMIASSARWWVLADYTNQAFSSKNRATAISTLSMGISLIFVVFMLVAGPIMEKFGGSPIFLTILGIIAIFTALPLGLNLAKNHSQE